MIIGLCGQAGSGKDTAADFLVKNHNFVKVALADPLKRICKEVFDFTDEQLWGPSAERNKPDERYSRKTMLGPPFGEGSFHIPIGGEFLTPRHALQQLGTEWGRNCYPNVWADYALRVAKKLLDRNPCEDNYYSAQSGTMFVGGARPIEGVVIPDVRFLNEVDAIDTAGGVVWRITRQAAGLQGVAGKHASETELEDIPADRFKGVIGNSGTLKALEIMVRRMLRNFTEK